MSFKKKNINDNSSSLGFREFFLGNWKILFPVMGLVTFFVLVLGAVVFYFLQFEASNFNYKNIGRNVTQSVTRRVGTESKKDDIGNINGLLIGYDGNYIADTIIIVSFDPNLGSISFLSLPRDFYIKTDEYNGKINTYLTYLNQIYDDKDKAINKFKDKINEIVGIDMPYYGIVDFQGFISFVNTIGGVTVDVPYTIYDTHYPDAYGRETVFHIEKGTHHLNGYKALKYARSRKTTSDFSRAARQQQIIEAMIEQILSNISVFDIPYLRDLYREYKNFVYTNLTFQETIGLVQYIDNLDYFFSSVYTAECVHGDLSYTSMEDGCFLYFPPREDYNGLSVILPLNLLVDGKGKYEDMQKYASIVLQNQKHLIEKPTIDVYNGISYEDIRQKYGYVYPVGNDFASDLVQYGFNVQNVDNYDEHFTGSTIYINQDKSNFTGTFKSLNSFLTGYEIIEVMSGDQYGDFEADLNIILGDNYVN